jgi:predicted dehydrogenase
MRQGPIGVGIIGAGPDRGWAGRAHVPALRALPGYRLAAVGTSRAESAQRAARLFGAEHAFTDPRALAEHPEVDLVAITVKVPAHLELVNAALAAGKHVYCEWPLARTTEEAVALAEAADAAGVHTAVGLQARYAPAVAYARELIAEGRLGRVTSVNLFTVRALGAGGTVPGWAAYTLDAANGAGLLEVIGGHALDTLEYLLGGFSEVSATLAVRHPTLAEAETGAEIAVTSPDHVLASGVLGAGVVASAHIAQAELVEPRTRLEVAGTSGSLAMVSTGAGNPEDVQLPIGELRLLAASGAGQPWRELAIPVSYRADAATTVAAAHNVSLLYRRLAEDIRTGRRQVPDFATGVRVHRLLDAVRRASGAGTLRSVS